MKERFFSRCRPTEGKGYPRDEDDYKERVSLRCRPRKEKGIVDENRKTPRVLAMQYLNANRFSSIEVRARQLVVDVGQLSLGCSHGRAVRAPRDGHYGTHNHDAAQQHARHR
jgi:hypothetical protein